MEHHSVKHDTFSIERSYPASTGRVFASWADPALKAKWFPPSEEFDFRIGGREVVRGAEPGGPVYTSVFTFQEIAADRRIIYTATLDMGDKRISVSVITVEFKPEGAGTQLVYTEQCAFLDGLDSREAHLEGAYDFLDKLGLELAGPN